MDPGSDRIVVDPHAFDQLWPALGIWLLLFLTAGDAWNVVRREAALAFGAPGEAVIVSTSRRRVPRFGNARCNFVRLEYESDSERRSMEEPVGAHGFKHLKRGLRRPAHLWHGWAFLDDDLGYCRWKLWWFVPSFLALWLWAIARYRFG